MQFPKEKRNKIDVVVQMAAHLQVESEGELSYAEALQTAIGIEAQLERSHYSNEICKRLDNLTVELNEIKHLIRQKQ